MIERLNYFGIAPLCNLKVTHGFFIGEFCFPLCVRCTSILFSVLLGIVLIRRFKIKESLRCYVISAIFILSCFIDGFLQYFLGIESNNLRRFIFGSLGGLGIAYIIYNFSNFLFGIIKK